MERTTSVKTTSKRILRSLTALLMAGILFATACGSTGKRENKDHLPTMTLALRSGIYSDVIINCLPKFEEEHGIFCEVLELSEEDLHSMVLEDAGREAGAYDLCMVDGSWMAQYTAGGVLADLSGLGYELDDDIIPATTEVCFHDGRVYLAPYYGNVTVLLFNKALLKEAGYDAESIESLQDIYEICEKTKAGRNEGFMYRGDTPNNIVVDFLPILLSCGGWVVDEENHPTVDTPEFHEAMELYLKLIATGKAEKKEDLIMAIANRAAVMGIGWPGWYTPTGDSSADYVALTGKKTDDSPAYNANVYGIWTIGIPENSPHKELAAELLTYLMDPEVQKSTVKGGGVPCRYSSLQDKEILAEFPQYRAVCEALEGGVYRPIMEEWSDFYTILGTEMGEIIAGNESVDVGLSKAQNDLEKMLGL